MNRDEHLHELSQEIEALIRLHYHGLYYTRGYQDRKARMKDFVRTHDIDMQSVLDPDSLLLYKRYLE